MAQKTLASHLRFHRKKTGLSQLEVAQLIGYVSEDAVMRHEQASSVPPLLVALAYEAIFRVPVAKLFPGIYELVEHGIETRLESLESVLKKKSAKDRDAIATARKQEWIVARRMGFEL